MRSEISPVERNTYDTVNVLADLLDIAHESLTVQQNIAAVQRQHLDVVRDVRLNTSRALEFQEQQLAQAIRVVKQQSYRRPPGDNRCMNKGYLGRLGSAERTPAEIIELPRDGEEREPEVAVWSIYEGARRFRSPSQAELDQEKEKNDRKHKRKVEVVKAAIEHLGVAKAKLLDARRALRQKKGTEIAEHSQRTVEHLSHARERMLSGQLAEATLELQGLLPVALLKLLDDVLLLLSQCSHLSGNATNTARQIQDAICFGASAPVGMGEDYDALWAKASAGLPKA